MYTAILDNFVFQYSQLLTHIPTYAQLPVSTTNLKFLLGVGFEKMFDSKFENFSVFRMFLLSKIVSNLNQIFLDPYLLSFEINTFRIIQNEYLGRRVTCLSSCLTGL
jgi:hypothetical protein